eukprot:TRINITY_DN9834_c0_g2_i1.p1 TRINITY_DN9834_c0_g2~~TRINITY_DN9834_c0_g2_i1.p1  ORF type:complete len:195 (+),score=20.58 TRINITY_DN9834_c0_g2_i1:1186-1770(+)
MLKQSNKPTFRHRCHKCTRTFKRLDHFRAHLLTHGDKKCKPYSCQDCGRSYTHLTTVRRHLAKEGHSGIVRDEKMLEELLGAELLRDGRTNRISRAHTMIALNEVAVEPSLSTQPEGSANVLSHSAHAMADLLSLMPGASLPQQQFAPWLNPLPGPAIPPYPSVYPQFAAWPLMMSTSMPATSIRPGPVNLPSS